MNTRHPQAAGRLMRPVRYTASPIRYLLHDRTLTPEEWGVELHNARQRVALGMDRDTARRVAALLTIGQEIALETLEEMAALDEREPSRRWAAAA